MVTVELRIIAQRFLEQWRRVGLTSGAVTVLETGGPMPLMHVMWFGERSPLTHYLCSVNRHVVEELAMLNIDFVDAWITARLAFGLERCPAHLRDVPETVDGLVTWDTIRRVKEVYEKHGAF